MFTSWKEVNPTCKNVSNRNHKLSLKPHLHALKNWYGTPHFWHHANDFKARHSQFLTCKCIGPKCNLAPELKILGVPRLPHRGSLGTGKRGTVPKIWRAVLIFSTCKWGLNSIKSAEYKRLDFCINNPKHQQLMP